jgi:hypothetical protein
MVQIATKEVLRREKPPVLVGGRGGRGRGRGEGMPRHQLEKYLRVFY